jgi:hypothetical protein
MKVKTPMDVHNVADLTAELLVLRFFPSDDAARLGIVLLIGRMAHNEDQVRWLVRRTLDLYNEWPGPLVLRQIFCSRFPPEDGQDVFSTGAFPDGVPLEFPVEQPAPLLLPAGQVASVDPELERAVCELAVAKDLNGPRNGHVHPVPVDTNAIPITEQDIENAVEKNRQAQALAEFKGDVQ